MAIEPNATSCTFEHMELAEGDTTLGAVLKHADKSRGIYQAVVR